MDVQFRALADPIRLRILRGLMRGEAQAGDIAAAFSVSRPAISHHLKVLSEAGLIKMRRQAQSRLYSIDAAAVMELRGRFNRFWDEALPRLKAVVESDQKTKRHRRPG
jgi:DNA-binding transcriptional ArsR family regulator